MRIEKKSGYSINQGTDANISKTPSAENTASVNTKENKKVEEFSEVLLANIVKQIDEDIETLLSKVIDSGEKFKADKSINTLDEYKNDVQKLLAKYIEKNQKVKVVEGALNRRTGERKVHLVVEVIDKKLEELINNFMSKQTGHINLAAQIDEIRGLLMDIIK